MHGADVTRSIDVPGFVQTLASSYKLKTRQFFGDASVDVVVDVVIDTHATLQPFVQYANVRPLSPTIVERGGTTLGLTGAVRDTTLQLGYSGEFAKTVDNHIVNVRATLAFWDSITLA